jgi:hypothetical protein
MNDRCETDDMPLDLRLAAIVTLLSASALRGPTLAKTAALRAHLAAAIADVTLPPELHDALEQSLAGWRAVECHPASVSVPNCPLTAPGQSLH